MNCKYCQAQLEENSAVCPACGAQQLPQEPETTQEPAVQEVPEVTEYALPEDAVVIPEEEENQEAVPDTVEEAAEESAEEPQPFRRKTWVKVVAVVCCAVLFLGLAAGVWCGVNGGLMPRENDVYYKAVYAAEDEAAVKAADTVVARIGDKELTNGQLQVYYWMNVYSFTEQYGNYLSYLGLDLSLPLSEQNAAEGETWEQYFLEAALNSWHNYQAILVQGESEGYQMSEELTTQLDATMENMSVMAQYYGYADAEEMIHRDMGPAADMEDYLAYLNIYYGGTEYFDSIYSRMDPTREEVEAYYDANAATIQSTYQVSKESGNLVDVRHILICPKGGTLAEDGTTTVYSDEEWETCRLEAESLLEAWRSGEATEDSFAALASEATEDPGSVSTGGLYTDVYVGQMITEFNDWCFDESRQSGDTGLVRTDYGYHVMYFVQGEEGWLRYSRQALITEKCTQILKDCLEENPMKVDYKKIVLGNVDLAD